MATPTEQYIATLTKLKSGDLGLLRSHAGQPLDATLSGFDLFTGVWWPIRRKYQRAPRREVAWLVAKLFAVAPAQHDRGQSFAASLARSIPRIRRSERTRAMQMLDAVLSASLAQIEPHLGAAIGLVAQADRALDWVQLTDDLSDWENRSVRQRWADQYLDA